MNAITTIDKPWGREELLERNEAYMLKRLIMHAGQRCSLQLHRAKRETIYVLDGHLRITVGPDRKNLEESVFSPGDVITISPGEIHRMEAVEGCVYLEASTPELDDVVRLSDDYNRM